MPSDSAARIKTYIMIIITNTVLINELIVIQGSYNIERLMMIEWRQ